MSLKNGEFINKIFFEIENITPLNIGKGEGEPLVDEESNKACIPGTTLAGAIRAYLELSSSKDLIEKLFGNEKDNNSISKIYVYDAYSDLIGNEIRPGVAIDRFSGAAKDREKFERKYIAKGHKFQVNIEIYSNNHKDFQSFNEAIYGVIKAIDAGNIALGSYKTNGAGLFKVNSIKEASYDLKDSKQLFSYLRNKDIYIKKDVDFFYADNTHNKSFVHYELDGELKTPLLVKKMSTLDFNRVDDEQFQNASGDYIIPGTSLKGVIRSQGERILHFFNKEELIGEIFGTSDNEHKISKFTIWDCEIQNVKKSIYSKIKLNRFTGGVSMGQKKEEEPVIGKVNIKGILKLKNESYDKEAIALIALIFRDIAKGELSLGSGNSVGRGRVEGRKLKIFMGEEVLFNWDIENNKVEKDSLGEYIEALRKRG